VDRFATGRTVVFGFGSAWAQAIADLEVTTLTAGLRYDVNSAYGDALSPRLALTRAWKRAHYKVLLSRAFRAPGIEHSRYDVDPERTTVVEGEVGFAPSGWAYATVGAYEVQIQGPLVYFYDLSIPAEGYRNGPAAGTRGATATLELKPPGPVDASVGWAWTAPSDRVIDPFELPGSPETLLGVASHKGVARLSAQGDALGGGVVGTLLSPRHAELGVDDSGAAVFGQLPAAFLLDANVSLSPGFAPGLSLQVSVHDLLDQAPPFVQPYAGGHPPLPSGGRAFGLSVTYAPARNPADPAASP
jgi:hypothetical protein